VCRTGDSEVVIPSERSQSAVIPSERSESRDLHLLLWLGLYAGAFDVCSCMSFAFDGCWRMTVAATHTASTMFW
jgi:hypothetical protein